MGKAKPAHHTSKELANKAWEATVNRGGGTKGKEDRQGGMRLSFSFLFHALWLKAVYPVTRRGWEEFSEAFRSISSLNFRGKRLGYEHEDNAWWQAFL